MSIQIIEGLDTENKIEISAGAVAGVGLLYLLGDRYYVSQVISRNKDVIRQYAAYLKTNNLNPLSDDQAYIEAVNDFITIFNESRNFLTQEQLLGNVPIFTKRSLPQVIRDLFSNIKEDGNYSLVSSSKRNIFQYIRYNHLYQLVKDGDPLPESTAYLNLQQSLQDVKQELDGIYGNGNGVRILAEDLRTSLEEDPLLVV